jgi:hypothetical protein
LHPDDVAEHVAEQVQDLRARLESGPEIGVRAVELDAGTTLSIRLVKLERSLIRHAVSSPLIVPGAAEVRAVYDVPDLGAKPQERELILRAGCDDFDGEPPTAELLLPDGTGLPADQWPREIANGGIVRDHPEYERPFFCRPGLREFHSHPQHEDQPWDRFRESMPLRSIVIGLLIDLRSRWMLK